MKITIFQFNMFSVNTYVIWDETTKETAIVDPGMIYGEDNRTLASFIEKNGLRPKYLINTHLHLDHTFGNDFVAGLYGLPVMANEKDEFLGKSRNDQARAFGVHGANLTPVTIGQPLINGEKLFLGKEYLEVIEVPGHSPGSIALYCPAGNFVITGDALFRGSIGRTDLPGGNHSQLINSVTTRLLSLPPSTVVYPGHGPSSTIAAEARSNPFL